MTKEQTILLGADRHDQRDGDSSPSAQLDGDAAEHNLAEVVAAVVRREVRTAVSALAPSSPNYGLPDVLTVEQAADFLGTNAKTIREAIAAGSFPARRVGRRVVILRDALLDWLRFDISVLPSRKRRK